jgi:hypothetical protein
MLLRLHGSASVRPRSEQVLQTSENLMLLQVTKYTLARSAEVTSVDLSTYMNISRS